MKIKVMKNQVLNIIALIVIQPFPLGLVAIPLIIFITGKIYEKKGETEEKEWWENKRKEEEKEKFLGLEQENKSLRKELGKK